MAFADPLSSGCMPVAAARPSLLARLADFAALHRQRRALSRLDAAALRDLGLSAEQARAEASRPAWDVPANWRR